jgi:hypothetical protein
MSKYVPFQLAYNVMNYGAHADGVTDDQPHVQAAVDAAHAAGGGIVYMPNGDYMFYTARAVNPDCGGNVNVRSGVTVLGESRAGVRVKGTRANAHPFAASEEVGIGVKNMTIYGTEAGMDGCKFYACEDVLVDQVTAYGMYIGVALYDCVNGLISNCLAHTMTGVGLHIGTAVLDLGVGVNCRVVDSEAYDCMYNFRTAGQDLLSETPRRFAGPTFTRCYAHGTGTGLFASYCSDLTVTDFTCDNGAASDIALWGVQAAHIHNSPAAYQGLDAHNHTMWLHYGDCSGIVED